MLLLLAAALAVQPSLPTGVDVQDRPFPALHYQRFPGQPPAAPLSWGDVVQGQLGTCFFLSSIAAVADARPGRLDGALRRVADGSYEATLHGADGRPVAVAVDDRFPATAAGEPYFARGAAAGDIRAALFEKAYAALLGGYDAVNGGEPVDALAALTGAAARETTFAGLSPERVWRLTVSALRARRPIVASTYDFADMKRLTGRDDLGGLIDDHVYAVLQAREQDGRKLVTLYTPLSPADAGYGRDGSRLLVLPAADFARLFYSVTVGR